MGIDLDRGPFGPLLRRFRHEAQMSQEELAERAKLSVESISALERGRRRAPYRETIRMLSDALGLSDAKRGELEAAAKKVRRFDGDFALSPSASTSMRYDSDDAHSASRDLVRSRQRSRPRLVRPLSTFHNRTRELADLAQLLADHRLITIAGPGGIGKTRLVIELALNLETRFADGAWFVDLAPLGDNSLVERSLIATLEITGVDGQADIVTLYRHLGDREALIVIDNCEHVIDQVAGLVQTLLSRCPNLRILTTSREPLDVSGERAYRISSLEFPAASALPNVVASLDFPAVHLFVERSRAANSTFTFAEELARPIAEICRRLDGIPLAIELAASRTAALSPQQILAQLGNHFDILSGTSRTSLPRHRTMRETVRWSYDRLTEAEKFVFRRSAIFVNGFGFEAIRFVSDTDSLAGDSILDILASLVNKSLVIVDRISTWPIYRVLEPIRAYGLEMLDRAGERQAANSCFARWALMFAQTAHAEWETSPSQAWSERVEPEMDNLRAALLWALDGGHDFELAATIIAWARRIWARLAPAEGKRWILAAQAHRSELATDELRAALGLALAHVSIALEQYRPALAAARACESRLDKEDASAIAEAREFAGFASVQLGDHLEGERLLAASMNVFKGLGAEQLYAHATSDLAIALGIRGDDDEARPLLREALTIFRKLQNENGIGSVAGNLAEMEYRAGNVEESARLVTDAIALVKSDREVRQYRLNLAAYLITLQRFAEAGSTATEVLLQAARAGADIDVAFAIQNLAAVAMLRSPREARSRRQLEILACLIGFVDSRLDASHTMRQFTEQSQYLALIDALNSQLGRERVDRGLREGRTWPEDEAIAAALGI